MIKHHINIYSLFKRNYVNKVVMNFLKKLGGVYRRKRKEDYVIVLKSQKQNNLKRKNVAQFQYRANKAFLDYYSSRGKLVTAVLLLSGEITKWLRMLLLLQST